jgi:hypothetical protein
VQAVPPSSRLLQTGFLGFFLAADVMLTSALLKRGQMPNNSRKEMNNPTSDQIDVLADLPALKINILEDL